MGKPRSRVATLANLLIICLLATASLLSGYRLWHEGLHSAEYSRDPTLWASAELPRIPAFHYGGGLSGTYVLAVGGQCSGCELQLDFYKRAAAAAIHTRKSTKLVVAYSRADAKARELVSRGGLDVMDVVPTDSVGPTPAVYFVDARGSVRGVWRGVLPTSDKEHILQGF